MLKTESMQVAGGEAGQDGEAAGGGQAEDGGGAEKVIHLRSRCVEFWVNLFWNKVIQLSWSGNITWPAELSFKDIYEQRGCGVNFRDFAHSI